MQKTSLEDVKRAVERHGWDAKAVAAALGLSVPNTYTRFRQLRGPHRVNGYGQAPLIHDTTVSALGERELSAAIPQPDPHFIKRPFWEELEDAFATPEFTTLLIGETGTGKSTAVEELAARKRMPFFRVPCGPHFELRAWLGKDMYHPATGIFFVESRLAQFLQAPTIILFDELNALEPKRGFEFHELFATRQLFVRDADHGRGRLYKVHSECRIFAAMNPPNRVRYAGIEPLNIALGNRLDVIACQPFTPQELGELLWRKGLETALTTCLVQLYAEGRALITRERWRYDLTARQFLKFATRYQKATSVKRALELTVINPALATAGEVARETLLGLAKTIFGEFLQ